MIRRYGLPAALLAVLVALGGVFTFRALREDGPSSVPPTATTPSPTPSPSTQSEVEVFVERFMRRRLAGRPVEGFLSAGADTTYSQHEGGLWLYDDMFPGGPGAMYRGFVVSSVRPAAGENWKVKVRVPIVWLGDSPPGEFVETLTMGPVDAGREPFKVLDASYRARGAAGLPLAVALARHDIFYAANGFDYDALRELIDIENFTYSFGESGDPIGYWRRLEEGHSPILGDILPGVLHTHYAHRAGIYTWPAAATTDPSRWTEQDLDDLRALGYGSRDVRRFERFGAYAGWRAGIRSDGTWLYFVAGD